MMELISKLDTSYIAGKAHLARTLDNSTDTLLEALSIFTMIMMAVLGGSLTLSLMVMAFPC